MQHEFPRLPEVKPVRQGGIESTNLISYVTLSRLPNLCVPPFPQPQSGVNSRTFLRGLEGEFSELVYT